MTIPDRTRLTGCAHQLYKEIAPFSGGDFYMRHYGLTPLRAAELTPAFPLRYGSSGQVDEIAAKEEE